MTFKPTQSGDIRVQRGVYHWQELSTSETVTLDHPVQSVGAGGNAFIKLNVLPYVCMYYTGDSSGLRNDHYCITAELTDTETITFTRDESDAGSRCWISWEVWEYQGDAGGANEFIVRYQGTISGINQSQSLSSVSDLDDCVAFHNGAWNDSTSDEVCALQHMLDIYNSAGTDYVRTQCSYDNSQTYKTAVSVVEFTGSNWNVEQVNHAMLSDDLVETETITDVGSWDTAFIVPTWKAENNAGFVFNAGLAIWPGASTTSLKFKVLGRDGSTEANCWVVQNDDLDVYHLDSVDGSGADFQYDTYIGFPDVVNENYASLIFSYIPRDSGANQPDNYWSYEWWSRHTTFIDFSHSGSDDNEWAMQVINLDGLRNAVAPFKPDKYWIAKLTLKKKTPDYDTKTIWVSDRTVRKNQLWRGNEFMWPIIANITGLGLEMGEALPNNRKGAIVLDCARGSYRYDMRLYDLLEEYSFGEQEIEIYSFEKPLDVIGDDNDLESEFKGKMLHLNYNADSKMLTVQIEHIPISSNLCTVRLNSTVYDAVADTPLADSAEGKYCPLPINDAWFTMIPLNNEGEWYSPADQYGPAFYGGVEFQDFNSDGSSRQWWVKNTDGVYGLCNVYSATNEFSRYSSSTYLDTDEYAYGWKLDVDFDNDENILLSMVRLRFHPYGPSADYNGDLIVTIHEYDEANDVPGRELARSVVQQADYISEVQGGSNFYVYFPLNKAVPFHNNGMVDYMLVFQSTDNTDSHWRIRGNSTASSYYWRRDQDTRDGHEWDKYGSGTYVMPYMTFYGCEAIGGGTIQLYEEDEQPYPIAIYGHELRNTSQDWEHPETALLEPVGIAYNGIHGTINNHYSSISNTNDVDWKYPFEALASLFYIQNGYSMDGLNTRYYKDSISQIADHVIQGTTRGAVTFRSLMIEICRNACYAVVPLRGSDLTLWWYGVEQEVAAILDEGDCTLDGFKVSSEDAIVNTARIAYDRSAVPRSTTELDAGEHANYNKSLEIELGQGGFDDFITDSVNVYGRKNPNDTFQVLDFIEDDDMAERYAEYLFVKGALERWEFTITVPFWKSNYRDLNVYDIVEVSHVDNPSSGGTAVAGEAKLPAYDGQVAEDFALGHVWRRAKRYSMRILSRKPNYAVGKAEPTITFRLRVLNNEREVY